MKTPKNPKNNFYSPESDPDGSYTGTRKKGYGTGTVLPGVPAPDEIQPVQDADDL